MTLLEQTGSTALVFSGAKFPKPPNYQELQFQPFPVLCPNLPKSKCENLHAFILHVPKTNVVESANAATKPGDRDD